jgi:hypothetical protein
MLEKMKALYAVFQQGKAVADPAAWRGHQITANMIAGLLFAIVTLGKACGYDFGIDMQTCADISIGLLALANIGINIATSKEHGVPSGAVREAEPSVQSVEQPAKEEPAAVSPSVTPAAERGSVASTIDDDVRQRAIEWAKQHSAINGLENSA